MEAKSSDVKKKVLDYFVGLDIGTNSVGWAVTNKEYEVLRAKGRRMWGARLFQEGQTTETRRGNRSARRRLDRRNDRLAILEELFAQEIAKVNPSFYQRLHESQYKKEHKNTLGKYFLFNGHDYTDKNYHKDYPTIFHLRKALTESEPKDIRMLFLAVHHIIKYRGNFLYEGETLKASGGVANNLSEVLVKSEFNSLKAAFENVDLVSILTAQGHTRRDKAKAVADAIDDEHKIYKKQAKAFASLVLGLESKLSEIFNEPEYEEAEKEIGKISFKEKEYWTEREKYEPILGESILALDRCKALYDALTLADIMPNGKSLSESKVEAFETHKKHLKLLKSVLKPYKESYNRVFKSDKTVPSNYLAYTADEKTGKKCKQFEFYEFLKNVLNQFTDNDEIQIKRKKIIQLIDKKEFLPLSSEQENIHNEHLELLQSSLKPFKETYKYVFNVEEDDPDNYPAYTKKKKVGNCCDRGAFETFIKNILNEIPDNTTNHDKKEEILQLIALENFLPLLRVRDNGVIPYQMHQEELEKMLENASKKYAFLNSKDDSGFTVAEKIVKLLTFRVPYYVGPLNPAHKGKKEGFAWVVRKEAGKVYPWNFEEKVDISATAAAFIENLTNKCTYLIGEDVLPRYSLAYSRFVLLNEVNNLRYNGKPFPYEIKQRFIKECFEQSNRKMTEGRIKDFLKRTGTTDGKGVLTGIDIDIKSNLSSYRDMVRILGEGFDHQMAESIIRYITLFGEEKKILQSTLEREFGNKLTKEQRDKLANLKYREWGRLSETFLKKIKGVVGDGPECNILECMERKPLILMEVLSSHNTYLAQIEAFNEARTKPVEGLDYELVDDLYLSPAVKRSVWQTLRVLDEVVQLRGGVPSKIFVEVARTNQADKKPTTARKKRLLQLYKDIENNKSKWVAEIEARKDGEFQSKKLYLYYTQMGKCMYSGRPIDLDKLFQNNLYYDIDHIYPRSVTKDDSWDNLVLVETKLNRDKTNKYPIESETRIERADFWKQLVDSKLISQKKYERLIRTTELTDDDLADFVNRQLVETNQSIKAVTTLLKRLYPNSMICYVKAENVASFRQNTKFVKLRSLNDHHHAKDAYLNVVVGNVYHEKFTNNPRNYIRQARKLLKAQEPAEKRGKKSPYNLTTMFKEIVNVGKRVIWNPDISYPIVKKMMINNDVQVTKKVIEQKGALYKATIYKANVAKDEGYAAQKGTNSVLNDVKKYGGFTSITNTYYSIFRLNKKKGNDYDIQIVPIPLMKASQFKDDSDYIDYMISLLDQRKYNSVELLYKKLCIGTLVRINGFEYYIGGRTGNSIYIDSAVSVLLDDNSVKKLKHIENYLGRHKENSNYTPNSKYVNIKFNEDVYWALVDKMMQPTFMRMKLNRSAELRQEKTFDNFKKLDITAQCKMIFTMLNLLTNQNDSDYKLNAIGVTASRYKLGMKLTKLDEFVIVNQSITGLYQQEHVIISKSKGK